MTILGFASFYDPFFTKDMACVTLYVDTQNCPTKK